MVKATNSGPRNAADRVAAPAWPRRGGLISLSCLLLSGFLPRLFCCWSRVPRFGTCAPRTAHRDHPLPLEFRAWDCRRRRGSAILLLALQGPARGVATGVGSFGAVSGGLSFACALLTGVRFVATTQGNRDGDPRFRNLRHHRLRAAAGVEFAGLAGRRFTQDPYAPASLNVSCPGYPHARPGDPFWRLMARRVRATCRGTLRATMARTRRATTYLRQCRAFVMIYTTATEEHNP